MNERLKKLRKTLDMTQQEFADKIGIARGNIGSYEVGKSAISNAVISLICKTNFPQGNVNENWLRTGEGGDSNMFIKPSRNEEMAKLTKQLLNEEEDSFKNRLISVLANLTDVQWEVLAEVAEKLSNEKTDD